VSKTVICGILITLHSILNPISHRKGRPTGTFTSKARSWVL